MRAVTAWPAHHDKTAGKVGQAPDILGAACAGRSGHVSPDLLACGHGRLTRLRPQAVGRLGLEGFGSRNASIVDL